MKYTREKGQSFEVSGGTTGIIFPSHPNGEHTIAFVNSKALYPEKGYAVNDRCTETVYVTKGELVITVDNKTETVRPGEFVMILPGQKYSIGGVGEAVDFITPAWDSKQNHIVP